MSRGQGQLDLIHALDEHQTILLALTFVITQVDNIFDTQILQAGDIHYLSRGTCSKSAKNEDQRDANRKIGNEVQRSSGPGSKIKEAQVNEGCYRNENDQSIRSDRMVQDRIKISIPYIGNHCQRNSEIKHPEA